jgi:DNA-binding CsgD family transcriptional regulator
VRDRWPPSPPGAARARRPRHPARGSNAGHANAREPVLHLLSMGLSNAEIGAVVAIDQDDRHVSGILGKPQVRSRTEAARRRQLGLKTRPPARTAPRPSWSSRATSNHTVWPDTRATEP